MDSPNDQLYRLRSNSSQTRQRLLNAAVELIAEVGWGRVTTRAIAERANLPHGTVSYHFDGKQALLVEAAVTTVEAMFPEVELATVQSIEKMFQSIAQATADKNTGRESAEVLLEAIRESSRDPVLRTRIAAVLRRLRERVSEVLVVADGPAKNTAATPSPLAIATVLVAAGDGLWLHRLLDPELDVSDALTAVGMLLGQGGEAK